MKIRSIGYLFREGFRSIFTHGFMSFASVTIITACLIIMGSISLLSVNIDAIIGDLEEQNEVVVFIDESYSEEEAQSMKQDFLSADNVNYVEFVSKTDAMDSFMENYDSELMTGIDDNVFRHRYVIHLDDISKMEDTKDRLESIPGVAKVKAHLEYSKTFISIRNAVTVVSFILIVVLVFVSVFIMTNTIKLATYGRREEIAIMKMVGATNGFIRTPFVIEGLTLGLLGGVLAYFAEYALYNAISVKLMERISSSVFSLVQFQDVSAAVLVVFLGIGAFVGVFGSTNAIRNYLKV